MTREILPGGWRREDNAREVRRHGLQMVQTTLAVGDESLAGSGVFSNVYRAHLSVREENGRWTRSRLVALKKSWPRSSRLALLRDLDHVNVVRLLYVWEKRVDGRLCRTKAFEFMSTTMNHLTNRRLPPLAPLLAKLYAFQLLRALAYCHERNICHRDVKPVRCM